MRVLVLQLKKGEHPKTLPIMLTFKVRLPSASVLYTRHMWPQEEQKSSEKILQWPPKDGFHGPPNMSQRWQIKNWIANACVIYPKCFLCPSLEAKECRQMGSPCHSPLYLQYSGETVSVTGCWCLLFPDIAGCLKERGGGSESTPIQDWMSWLQFHWVFQSITESLATPVK